jgi:dihydropteroate synthase type 2
MENIPSIFGIVNITEDSFSDGGKYLAAGDAIAHARALAAAGADVIDLGAAASNIRSAPIAPEVEIARLAPVVSTLHEQGVILSIDSFSTPVQRWALSQGVAYLNDIQGFSDPELYPDLAASKSKLVVMHSVQGRGRATEANVRPFEIYDRILTHFQWRIKILERAGVDRERLILDPGMGFFLSSDPQTSFEVLRRLPELKQTFKLPVLIGVSRKSFLRKITNRQLDETGPSTLAAELYAAAQGADGIRTHDAGALHDALAVWQAAVSGIRT